MRIIAARGSRFFTARAVAAEVGITEGAIFRHFPHMEAIAATIVERMEAILFQGFPPQDPDPLTRLGLFFKERVCTLLQHPYLVRFLLTDQLAQVAGPEHAQKIQLLKQRSQRFVQECLREAQVKGELALDATPQTATLLIMGTILAFAHGGQMLENEKHFEDSVVRAWSLLERALRGDGKPPGEGKTLRHKSHPHKGVSHGKS